jgi:predicted SAM-dependent methyltransferase
MPLHEVADGQFVSPIMVGEVAHQVSGFETLHLSEFLCPICGSPDKARLYALFMSTFGVLPNRGGNLSMLHFAPEGGLATWIGTTFPELHYVTADLFRSDVDLCLDVTQMNSVASESFDYFIFSHILEHVDDEQEALAELRRILRAGGWGIVMVPILLSLESTYSDPSVTSPSERTRHFGLEDHLRVHSRDGFLALLESAGFAVQQYTVADWDTASFTRLGIARGSVLYVVRRA